MDTKALSMKSCENYRIYNWSELVCTTVSLADTHHEVPELLRYGVSAICDIRIPICCPYPVWHVIHRV